MNALDYEVQRARLEAILTDDGVVIALNIINNHEPFKELQRITNLSLNKIADILNIPRSTLKLNVRNGSGKYNWRLSFNIEFFIAKYIGMKFIKDNFKPIMQIRIKNNAS